MLQTRWAILLVWMTLSWVATPLLDTAQTAEPEVFSREQLEFFEAKVRPLLVQQCYECHSGKAQKLQAKLRLDGRELALKGGESGPALVPGKPDASLLVQSIRWESFEMPPRGKLSAEQIAILTKWVELGAPWPAENAATGSVAGAIPTDWDAARRSHWAWRPVQRPPLPSVANRDWPRAAIDFFVLARLEAAAITPAPPADRRTLIRRATFDLLGVPPDAEEVERFVADRRPDAWQRVVDRLLQSPLYGQRWGRHWLDVARYSDGHGGFLDNAGLPEAWRYRDWVVQAMNNDLPYDRFLQMQVAGDLLNGHEGVVATGFFALGPTYRSDGGDPESVAQARSETLDDRVDTLSRGMLALTVSCARCHDHKFDPIQQLDYYSLAGVFNNTASQPRPLADQSVVEVFDEHQRRLKVLQDKINKTRNTAKKQKREISGDEQSQVDRWQSELDQRKAKAPPGYPVAHGLAETGSADMHVAIRGDLRRKGPIAPRRFVKLLDDHRTPQPVSGSGRLQLAKRITAPENPLTTRVIVNRIWMHHFGNPLVSSPDNFGKMGELPTHPLLLDWLAARLIDSGWSIKSIHREIMLSASYQVSSRLRSEPFARDGDNRLLWRMSPRRLDVEAWRDGLLAVTGELEPTLGGPPTDQLDSRRRTIHLMVSRNGDRFATDELLRLFDFPMMRATVARRPSSIVPQQFLFLLNSPFMVRRAQALVVRLHTEVEDDPGRIRRAYMLLYARLPNDDELQLGLDFLAAPPAAGSTLTAWQQYAQVLLGANEFMYVR